MGEIALGQYYPSNSILHRLDPRVKLVGTLVYIVSLFLVKGVFGYAFCACALAAVVLLSRVPIRLIAKSMKPVLWILLFTTVFNLLLTPGRTVASFWIFRITEEGIRLALTMGIRLVLLVTGSSIMTLTTTPNALTDGMERLFAPLSVLHVPVHEISLMMSIALRFIPILTEEADKIRMAQMARGADFESGGLIRRLRSMIPILVPLFVSAFRRANDLAMAMESRCYHGGAGRTQMKPLKFGTHDCIAGILLAVFLSVCIACCVFGY